MSESRRLLQISTPYLLFLGDVGEIAYAKTALGLRDWARSHCLCEYALPGGLSIGLPQRTPIEAFAAGARSLVIGVATPGGAIPEAWMGVLLEAIEAGLDIVSGMHAKLNDMPALVAHAETHGRRLIDVRTPPADIPIASGRRRSGKRLLTVGTDCALGKKYTALALTHAFAARGVNADFRATGQTGIMIAGGGMPIDAVVSDFAAGAAEMLSPNNAPDHWDIIEGQGSLFHPAYGGVSLALLHGSQPDVVVLCHDPTRTTILGHPRYPLPTLEEAMALAVALGARTNPQIRCAGVAMNTSRLDSVESERLMQREAERLSLPVADPIRGGVMFEALVASCLADEAPRT